jgi:hypothetical protein
MNVWVAIPTDGTRGTLSLCLASLAIQERLPTGILICENGSRLSMEQDTVVQMIKFLRASGVQIVMHYCDLPREGFTKLRHHMLQACHSLRAEHVLLLDDDAMLTTLAFRKLIDVALEHPKFGWVSPVLLYPESLSRTWGAGLDFNWRMLLRRWSPDDGPEIVLDQCVMAATTCLLVHLERCLDLGGFDFYQFLPDFAEDRFFTARFFGRHQTIVHRGAECYVTSGMANEGKRWKMPVDKLLLREELAKQLHPSVLEHLRNGKIQSVH